MKSSRMCGEEVKKHVHAGWNRKKKSVRFDKRL